MILVNVLTTMWKSEVDSLLFRIPLEIGGAYLESLWKYGGPIYNPFGNKGVLFTILCK